MIFHYIQNTHNLKNDIEIQSVAAISKVDTLEEGKSRFLQFIVDFNSREDVFNLLQWIKSNDTNTFMTYNPQEIDNQVHVFEENISKTTEVDDEKILHEEDIGNADSNSEVDLDQEHNFILTQGETNSFMTKQPEVENQDLVFEENISKLTEEDDDKSLDEHMNNPDSILAVDLDQENDVILTQSDTNKFMTKHQGIATQLLNAKEDISETTKDNDEKFFQEDMNVTDSDLMVDLNQELDLILSQREIVQISDEETFSSAKYLNQHILVL